MSKLKLDINQDKPTGNFWIDNGLVVLFDEFGTGEFEISYIKNKLVKKLTPETGNEDEYYNENLDKIVKYKKRNWIYPSNNFIKAVPPTPKIEINGKKYFVHPPQYDLKLSFSSKTEVCAICGEKAKLINAKMWMFPFAVEPKKFSNFYSGFKQGTKVCPKCALSGVAGYLGWLWRAQGKRLHVFVFHADLKYLYNLRKNVLVPLEFQEASKAGNIPVEFYGNYLHETVLGLLLRLFKEIKKTEDSSLPEQGLSLLEEILEEKLKTIQLTLFAFSGTMAKAFNMDSMFEFSEFNTIYKLYTKWINKFSNIEGNPHHIVTQIFRQFQRIENNKIETIWRDKISWAILELRDPTSFIEDFLFEVKYKEQVPLAFGTIEVFELYLKEVTKMDEKLMSVLRGFGHSFGSVAQKEKEMGLLYALRNSKNPEDFFKTLNDIQFRLGLTVPEDLLLIEKGEKIKGSPWLRVKTLLSIYAMNSYLYSTKSTTKED